MQGTCWLLLVGGDELRPGGEGDVMWALSCRVAVTLRRSADVCGLSVVLLPASGAGAGVLGDLLEDHDLSGATCDPDAETSLDQKDWLLLAGVDPAAAAAVGTPVEAGVLPGVRELPAALPNTGCAKAGVAGEHVAAAGAGAGADPNTGAPNVGAPDMPPPSLDAPNEGAPDVGAPNTKGAGLGLLELVGAGGAWNMPPNKGVPVPKPVPAPVTAAVLALAPVFVFVQPDVRGAAAGAAAAVVGRWSLPFCWAPCSLPATSECAACMPLLPLAPVAGAPLLTEPGMRCASRAMSWA